MKLSIILLMIFTVLLFSCGKKESGGNQDKESGIKQINKEEIKVKSEDGKSISADYFYISKEGKEPIVILIHQFRSNKEQWSKILIDTLLRSGFKVLTYDIRSHGASDKADVKIEEILTNRNQAPKDLEAIVKWTRQQNEIDTGRIGIAGTSIGGSLSLYGKYYLNIKAAVCISIGNLTFNGLTGVDMRMGKVFPKVSNVLLVCGTKDGDYAKESQEIFDNYLGEPKEYKQFDSELHGKDLMQTFPGINDLILNWFKKNL